MNPPARRSRSGGRSGQRGQAAEGGHRLPAHPDPTRTRTPGSRHQLKAVKVNEGGRGAWHRSMQAHKGGFLKSRESSSHRTPAGAFHRGAHTSDPSSGPQLSPEAPRAPTRQEWPRDSLGPGRRPPSPPRATKPLCAPSCREAISGLAQRRPRARRHRLARRCQRSLGLPARSRSPPKPAARRACPVPLRGARARAAKS